MSGDNREYVLLENQNLKLQVENLKYEDALRKMKAENDSLKEKNKNLVADYEFLKESKKIDVSKLEDKLSKKDEEIKKLAAEKQEVLLKHPFQQGKGIDNLASVLGKNLSAKEQNILEGIRKFVERKRTAKNVFKSYVDWFAWINENTEEEEESIIFEDCIFAKFPVDHCSNEKLIYITEYQEFPIIDKELVIPAIDKGWDSTNTQVFMMKCCDSSKDEIMVALPGLEGANEPNGVGKYLSIKIKNNSFQYECECECEYNFLVFVRKNISATERIFNKPRPSSKKAFKKPLQ